MNLADAIRRASTDGVTGVAAENASGLVSSEVGATSQGKATETPRMDNTNVPEPANPNVTGGNVVRLELFLTAEQMSGMFRAIMAGQHTVMTLREAASYLRVNASKLVKLAESGEVPGVLIEGSWRFPKPNLDDWLTMQTVNHEDQEDVA